MSVFFALAVQTYIDKILLKKEEEEEEEEEKNAAIS